MCGLSDVIVSYSEMIPSFLYMYTRVCLGRILSYLKTNSIGTEFERNEETNTAFFYQSLYVGYAF